jgi:hypothetical protein
VTREGKEERDRRKHRKKEKTEGKKLEEER